MPCIPGGLVSQYTVLQVGCITKSAIYTMHNKQFGQQQHIIYVLWIVVTYYLLVLFSVYITMQNNEHLCGMVIQLVVY